MENNLFQSADAGVGNKPSDFRFNQQLSSVQYDNSIHDPVYRAQVYASQDSKLTNPVLLSNSQGSGHLGILSHEQVI